MTSFAVLGAGAWGTALANVLGAAGRPVTLWARDPAQAAAMTTHRENQRRLPGVRLADAVRPTSDLADCGEAAVILVAVPTQALRTALQDAAPVLRRDATLVLCAKGIERGTACFPSAVAREAAPAHPLAILSGPSFAADVSRGLPTAVTLACEDGRLAASLCEEIGSRTFRPYAATDVRGVEVGGATKNVLAIACGIAEGRGLGLSARAALTARGFAELARFGASMGAKRETLMGLSGLGDLLLTCGSAQSRNFSLGLALGQGAASATTQLTEGVWTAPVLATMARERGIDMPIVAAVEAVLAGRLDIAGAVETLLARPYRTE